MTKLFKASTEMMADLSIGFNVPYLAINDRRLFYLSIKKDDIMGCSPLFSSFEKHWLVGAWHGCLVSQGLSQQGVQVFFWHPGARKIPI